MNKIYAAFLILIPLLVLPAVFAEDACIDLACLENYSVWDDADCLNELCVLGFSSAESPECYNTLCTSQDIILPEGCEAELCPDDTSLPAGNSADLTTESGLRSQFNFYEDKIDSLKLRISAAETEIASVKSSVKKLGIDEINKKLSLIQQNLFIINASIKSLESAQDDLLSPSTNYFQIALYTIMGIIALGVVIANFVSFSEISRLKKPKVSQEKIYMIKKYESTYRSQGYPASAIRQGLHNQGFTDEQISLALKK